MECYWPKGVGRLYQINVLLTTLGFWKLYKHSSSRISGICNIPAGISWIWEVPGAVALALAYLHSNAIIHRDLSSNNVLLIGEGSRAKVTDFGMSKLMDMNPRMTPLLGTG